MDERIIKGTAGIGTDKPIALLMTENGIELSGESISYAEMADWLLELHRIAEELATYSDS